MIIVIDNYDSFTYNLVQYFGEMHTDVRVFRNDAITIPEIEALAPDFIVISPGPGAPEEAGISKEVILQLGPRIPTLGICLGHQCLGEVYGGKVAGAPRLMHGKTSAIYHYGDELFSGLSSPFTATRYHSLIVNEEGLPEELEIIAFTRQGEIMGLRHREFPIYGLQFHPESILTEKGKTILKNFLTVKAPVYQSVI
jgi:anthranilate synthase/aminodeoxychorismate synthase-like glutamine amidotransferase